VSNLKINVAIDDVHPQKGWRILGDQTEIWLRQLHDEFGLKYTLFVPSNYHGQYPLSDHKGWLNELKSIEWIEIACHGNLHQTTNPQLYGECEFFELQNGEEIHNRLWLDCDREWAKCGFDINEMGWRNPGWLCSDNAKAYIERTFKYVAIHYEHNRNAVWNCKTFFGHDGINTNSISVHNENMIMLQSHIAGSHNDNVWNESNFNHLRELCGWLFENNKIEPTKLIDSI